MRCDFQRCRAVLVERIDRLGRVTYTCPGCTRRKAGVCQTCPSPVEGEVGRAFYCAPCKKRRRRVYVMKWQRNNLDKVAIGARRRRWLVKHGRRPPKEKMTLKEAGKLGGKKGAAARIASIGPERVREIALKANAARWAKHRRQLCQTVSSSVAEKSPSPTPLPPSGKA